MNEDFDDTSVTVSHDHAGNLIDDGTNQFVYDAWNRLVKVRSAVDTDVTLQTSEFDGQGRRIKKVVSNTGQWDGTTVYLFDGQKIIETRDGSNNLVQQFIHGTQYIDELVMMRVKSKGDLYVHQDANWNVIALTDLGGSVVERNVYTPYGEVTVHQETSYGDRDGDGDVDSTDKGTVGVTCTGTVTGAYGILDLDFDGDYDSADATLFDSLPSGLARHPGRFATGVNQPFAHQGLLYEPEIASYQNRARQYDPAKRRFVQRDPLDLGAGTMNVYEYVSANPLTQSDPSGLACCTHAADVPTDVDGQCGHICHYKGVIQGGYNKGPAFTTCCTIPLGECSAESPDNCHPIICKDPALGYDYWSNCPGKCIIRHEDKRVENRICNCGRPFGYPGGPCEGGCRGWSLIPKWQRDCNAYTESCGCMHESGSNGCLSCGTPDCNSKRAFYCCMKNKTCAGMEDAQAQPLCQQSGP